MLVVIRGLGEDQHELDQGCFRCKSKDDADHLHV